MPPSQYRQVQLEQATIDAITTTPDSLSSLPQREVELADFVANPGLLVEAQRAVPELRRLAAAVPNRPRIG
jgi:hypothetical protein